MYMWHQQILYQYSESRQLNNKLKVPLIKVYAKETVH